jgi:hypothetical protein
MISSEEARMIIKKWFDESPSVRCNLVVDGGIRISVEGKVDLLNDEGFGIRADDYRCWVRFPFHEIEFFDYGDARSTSEQEKAEFVAKTYEGILGFKTAFAFANIGELKANSL